MTKGNIQFVAIYSNFWVFLELGAANLVPEDSQVLA